jgi:hypothetical protein
MSGLSIFPCQNNAPDLEAIGKSVSRPHCGMHKFAFELLSPERY